MDLVEGFYAEVTTCSSSKRDIAIQHDRTVKGAHRKPLVGTRKRVVCVYPDRCKLKVRWEGILSILFKSVGVSKRTSLYSVGYTTLLFH